MHKLKKARLLKELTQMDLRFATGINQCKISWIEKGYVEPRPDEKIRLARALQIPVEELFPSEVK